MNEKIEIKKEAKKRTHNLKFGDAVTNICAGENNPMRHCYYVRNKKDTVECTDKNGHFWDIYNKVIYPGHLNERECKKLFAPIWNATYGN